MGLTDRTLKSLKPALSGETYDQFESDGFGVRVSDKGTKTFILAARYGGKKHPTRRAMGRYPALSLAAARKKAEHWRELIASGKDPAIEEERHRAAELRRQENTFASVAEDFIKEKLIGRDPEKPLERSGREVERDIRRVFIPAWGKRPMTDITAQEVRNLIKGYKDDGKPYQAHNLLGYARRLFNWAIGQTVYGIEASPCDRLKPKDIIGERPPRTRILSDKELRAAWVTATDTGYPYGPLFRLLILTGQRKSEVANARWREFDLEKKIWTIPADRMKAAAAHIVPLSDDAIAVLESLPRFDSGDYLFSATFGKKPVNGFYKAKVSYDVAVLAALREKDDKAKLPDFVIHDIRRTVRTGLSAIPNISDLVRELVIGHTKPGLHKVYDQHAYLDEKRFALDAWAARLRGIINPAAGNVVELRVAQ
ncbi:MAG TPA: integrase arm-type DNA-binding domain-containing protein [Xanthobacteraceae bacterium]|nr:integrase arm-type DNA-binding domain-containing protein [Xanthobacteraceae bacterium]